MPPPAQQPPARPPPFETASVPSGRACCSANAGGERGARGRRKWCRGRTSNWRSRCASTSARSTWPDSSMSRSLKSLLASGRLYALAPSTAAARTTPTIWIVRRAILLLRASAPPAQSPPPRPQQHRLHTRPPPPGHRARQGEAECCSASEQQQAATRRGQRARRERERH